MKQNDSNIRSVKEFNSRKFIFFLVIFQLVESLFFFGCANPLEKIDEPISRSFVDEKIRPFRARFDRQLPVVAVIGDNEYTELSDFVVPYGVLARSKVAEVYALGTKSGRMRMFPTLEIEIQKTLSDFDRSFPEGADFVIVPAVHNSENPDLIRWIQLQTSKGATVVGICDGAWLLANAGILKGKRATGHWYSLNNLEKKFTETEWIRNRHYVADGNIITTTGVTASIPISIALVESIAGKKRARQIAKEFGVIDWGTAHNTSNFEFESRHYWTAIKNFLSFWSYENIGIKTAPGIDETTLALVADSYARTFKTNVFAISDSGQKIQTRGRLTFFTKKIKGEEKTFDRILENVDIFPAVIALDKTLSRISSFYGTATSSFVAIQIEYLLR
ncbi:DJ-1/PfpI family protein [Leptospira sp. 201903070]|uniref:DJ-1/PfpI family protein n=1 Tax=Leptospira ainlahdjerensis TaxID=2810033 RepID=A0ABS2U878_9LEPT|nr:DJ-1/PfpI family protein [Leptospira ainlahdjerensis]